MADTCIAVEVEFLFLVGRRQTTEHTVSVLGEIYACIKDFQNILQAF
jgi:hypothetical protein